MNYVQILKRFQAWRLGEYASLDECGLTPELITETINWAINNLEGMEDDGK